MSNDVGEAEGATPRPLSKLSWNGWKKPTI